MAKEIKRLRNEIIDKQCEVLLFIKNHSICLFCRTNFNKLNLYYWRVAEYCVYNKCLCNYFYMSHCLQCVRKALISCSKMISFSFPYRFFNHKMFVPFICNDFWNQFLSELDIDDTILLNLFLTVIKMLSLKKFL